MRERADDKRKAPRKVCWLFGVLAMAAILTLVVAPPTGAQDKSRCSVVPNKVAAPAVIQLGATVRVTLTLSADCPPEVSPVDVVLVVDQSNSMANDSKLVNAKAAALAFLDAMDLNISRVGLVAFNHDAGVRSQLSHDRRPVEQAVASLVPGGQTNISAAIEVARVELARDPQGHSLAMIVLTDGYNTVPGAEPVPDAAARAKADGITVVTVCAGGQCDPDLEPAASRPELYFNVPDTTQLAALYRDLAGALQANVIVSLTIRDQIPANMRYIPNSAVPPATTVGSDYLEWVFAGTVPVSGLSYDLEPLEAGVHPTNVTATANFLDRRGLPGETVFPIPVVTVIAPPCAPLPLEVYFLIDDSNCLYGAWLNGEPALAAIKKGIADVLDMMVLGRDTASVIGFGDQAIMLQTLTTDREAVLSAVDQVSFRDGTARLDLGFAEVARERNSPRHRSSALPVTITVTDGPMTPSLALVQARADALRRQGFRHYAIGVGDSLLAQHAVLRAISEANGYREIPYDGDVITAYHELGEVMVKEAIPWLCRRAHWVCLPTALRGAP